MENVENPPTFAKVMGKSIEVRFWTHSVMSQITCSACLGLVTDFSFREKLSINTIKINTKDFSEFV